MNRHEQDKYKFSSPGYYRIVVNGNVSPVWLECLGSMQVKEYGSGEERDTIILQGLVSDQAELSGILNTIYDIHLMLLSVEFLGYEPID